MAPGPNDADAVDRITHNLFPQFEGTPEEEGVKSVVAAEFSRWRDVPVKDYVAIFVERRLRRTQLLAHPQPR
jgi:hypothetical protein